MPRYEAICAHWERVPPVSICVAALARKYEAIGAPKKKGAGADRDRASQRQALMDMLGGSGFSSEKPEWLRATTK